MRDVGEVAREDAARRRPSDAPGCGRRRACTRRMPRPRPSRPPRPPIAAVEASIGSTGAADDESDRVELIRRAGEREPRGLAEVAREHRRAAHDGGVVGPSARAIASRSTPSSAPVRISPRITRVRKSHSAAVAVAARSSQLGARAPDRTGARRAGQPRREQRRRPRPSASAPPRARPRAPRRPRQPTPTRPCRGPRGEESDRGDDLVGIEQCGAASRAHRSSEVSRRWMRPPRW